MCLLVCISEYGKKIKKLTYGIRFQKNREYVRLRIQVEKERFRKDESLLKIPVNTDIWRL